MNPIQRYIRVRSGLELVNNVPFITPQSAADFRPGKFAIVMWDTEEVVHICATLAEAKRAITGGTGWDMQGAPIAYVSDKHTEFGWACLYNPRSIVPPKPLNPFQQEEKRYLERAQSAGRDKSSGRIVGPGEPSTGNPMLWFG